MRVQCDTAVAVDDRHVGDAANGQRIATHRQGGKGRELHHAFHVGSRYFRGYMN
jgi:hypothetical protein